MPLEVEHTPEVIGVLFIMLFVIILGMIIIHIFSPINEIIGSDLLNRILRGDIALISALAISGTVVIFVYAYKTVQGE